MKTLFKMQKNTKKYIEKYRKVQKSIEKYRKRKLI